MLLSALASDLRSIGYSVDGVAELLGDAAHAALQRDQLIPALIVTEAAANGEGPSSALAAVVRLWLLAEPQTAERLDAALPGIRAEGLVTLGLAEHCDAGIAALVDFRPYGWDGDASTDANANADGGAADGGNAHRGRGGAELWVASDLAAHQQPGVLRHDHVLGIGQASTTLVQTTIRRQVPRALDLGTGCGIQTFHLLQHAEHVTATDISERALAFTRFNLTLNAEALRLNPEALESRVSLRLGSLLEPVAGEQFDLVVSNPPFVITPRNRDESTGRFTYRDGGLAGDDIVASLVRTLPGILAPGGTAQLLGNWEITAGTSWEERPKGWVDADTDAWFIQREQLSPELYAETWLRDASENRDRRHYQETYAAYLDDFASREVAGIGFGMIWLRRPSRAAGPVLTRFEEITYPIEQPIGPYLGAAVERTDWLVANDLEAAHLLVAEDVTEERHQRPGAEHPGVILLRQGAGLRRTNLLSTELAGFVSACDGDLSVGQIIGALVALLGAEEGFDSEEFPAGLLADVGNLVLDGFLLPV